MKLIEGARQWWRLWSIRLNAIGLALLGWVQFDPVSALSVWNMLPGEVRAVLPRDVVALVGGLFFVLSMLARLVHQPTLRPSTGSGPQDDRSQDNGE